jgi:protein MAK11
VLPLVYPTPSTDLFLASSVKALDVLVSQGSTFVATVSSDGRVHLYDLDTLLGASASSKQQEVKPIAVYDTKASRLTCVTITEGGMDYTESILKRKRKHGEGDEDDNETEEC